MKKLFQQLFKHPIIYKHEPMNKDNSIPHIFSRKQRSKVHSRLTTHKRIMQKKRNSRIISRQKIKFRIRPINKVLNTTYHSNTDSLSSFQPSASTSTSDSSLNSTRSITEPIHLPKASFIQVGTPIGPNLFSVEILGKGNFGSVHRVNRGTSETFALKIQPLSFISRNEVEVLKRLVLGCDQHTICLVDSYEAFDEFSRTMASYILMKELVGYIELAKFRVPSFSPRFVAKVLAGVCDAVSFIHGRNVAHLDIKAGNLLWNPEKEQIMLIDFGLSVIAETDQYQLAFNGTPYYMDYIALQAKTVNKQQLMAQDLWAIGVLSSLLMTGNIIWQYYDLTTPAAISKYILSKRPIFNPQVPEIVSLLERNQMVMDVAKEHKWSYANIQKCLHKQYTKRTIHPAGSLTPSIEQTPEIYTFSPSPISSPVARPERPLQPDPPSYKKPTSKNPFARS